MDKKNRKSPFFSIQLMKQRNSRDRINKRFGFGCCCILAIFTLHTTIFGFHNYLKENQSSSFLMMLATSSQVEGGDDSSFSRLKATHNNNDDTATRQCSIYMAPSSIKGVPSMGIYTTRNINDLDENLLRGGPDGPSITLLADMSRSDKSVRFPHSQIPWLQLWGNYAWGMGKGLPDHIAYEAAAVATFFSSEGGENDHNKDDESLLVLEHQTTFGALPNHHCVLGSLAYSFPNSTYDDSLSSSSSPSFGAYSYNVGRDWHVNRQVSAGEEIFLNYGHCQRQSYPDWIPSSTPTPEEYEVAAKILYKTWLNATSKTQQEQNDGEVEDNDENKREEDQQKNSTPIIIPSDLESKVSKLLPSNLDEIKHLWNPQQHHPQNGKDSNDETVIINEIMRALARHNEIEERSPEWIHQHGKCLEHLRSEPSTLDDAGRGGFAQHFIPKGDIVVPSPMIHVMDQDLLSIYDHQGNGKKISDQLVLNYCFGHSKSTVLLCPSTNALLLNHCSKDDQKCQVNAKLKWATDDLTSEEWRQNLTLAELSQKTFRGLMMEVVAIRDIAVGEEVFMDYGAEWEQAWNQHRLQWNSQPHSQLRGGSSNDPKQKRLSSAKEANDANHPPPELIRKDDLRADDNTEVTNSHHRHHFSHQDGDGDYLFAGCRFWPLKNANDENTATNNSNSTAQKIDPNWKEYIDEEIVNAYATDGSIYYYDDSASSTYEHHRDFTYWPCSIIRQEEGGGQGPSNKYLVRIWQSPFHSPQLWSQHGMPPYLLTNYPRESIHFFVESKGGDQYQSSVFRHSIGIPDDSIFPEHWKNLI